MKKIFGLCFGFLAFMGISGCHFGGESFVNRGLQQQARRIQAQVDTSASKDKKIKEGTAKNYESHFEIQVSPNIDRGLAHDSKERSNLPDLRLYVRLNGQRTQLGEASNAQTMSVSYPLPLKSGDTVEVRLVDKKNSYYRTSYDSSKIDDWSGEFTPPDEISSQPADDLLAKKESALQNEKDRGKETSFDRRLLL